MTFDIGKPTEFRYGYVSNGFVQHRLEDALTMLAEQGYAGVGLVLDPHHFNPFEGAHGSRLRDIGALLGRLELSVVIETGASFLLDPRRKHEPTFVSPEYRERRIALLIDAIRIAAELQAEAVSFWSGVVHDGAPEQEVWDRLLPSCASVVEEAQRLDVKLAFEPEPGMFIDTVAGYRELLGRLGNPEALGLTLDIGHIRCNEPEDEAKCIEQSADRLAYVQIDDMRVGVHEHLNFGDGEVDFDAALAALQRIGYKGLISVELSRHSHAAHQVIPSAIDFLRRHEPNIEQVVQ